MNGVISSRWRLFRRWLAALLQRWAAILLPDPASGDPGPPAAGEANDPPPAVPTTGSHSGGLAGVEPSRADALCPAVRQPLSVEDAVLERDMTVLRREAADSLAALGAAHALVASARLAQLQQLRPRVEDGKVEGRTLMALAADYQAWQNDQVRLFDAMALVLRMRVPEGNVLDQVDPALHEQARNHLQSLSLEYQRRLLMSRFPSPADG